MNKIIKKKKKKKKKKKWYSLKKLRSLLSYLYILGQKLKKKKSLVEYQVANDAEIL